MTEQANIWPKHITVDKRIVQILSGSTYSNFPRAIKEIITNSYDADAENVWIDIDLKKEIITIKDDGHGMNEEDFAFYLRIAGKTRKKDVHLTKSKRQIIGQFGVGFLSALPFCQKYIIETKRKNTDEVVHATISSTEYFKPETSAVNVDEIPINGSTKKDSSVYHDQYTRIRLVGFSTLTKAFFDRLFSVGNKRNTIYNYEPLELLQWQLSEYLPLSYDLVKPLAKDLSSLFKSDSKLPFKVHFNGRNLYRHIHANSILEFSDKVQTLGDIKFTYAILSSYEPIAPIEARYLMIRNLNVGVERTTFDLGLDGKVYGKLAHLTGEVNIIEGLNELISVSRDKFNFSPSYEKLKEFLRQKMAKWANELDSLKSSEKFLYDFQNDKKVSTLENIRSEKVSQQINVLKNKGFSVKNIDNIGSQAIKIVPNKKEIFLPKNYEDFSKSINVLGVKYKLIINNWNSDENPAPVKITNNELVINEDYPLFKNSSSFDTFLKIHILWAEYLRSKLIDKKTYLKFIQDLDKLFNA
jgi:hypothetical protein